jgi:uroporphyrinogen-III decarboxylase
VAAMNSRERLLTVLRYQEPDHVPLVFNPFGFVPPPHLAWSNQFEEAQAWLSIGADAWLDVAPPIRYHPDVTTREWLETIPGERWPVMIKEYHTPAGVLRQEVYRTEDWVTEEWPQHKAGDEELRLLDDYSVARYRRAPIQDEQDVERLKYLFHPLSDEAIAEFREGAYAVARRAEELGVMVTGMGINGGDAACWLCGAQGMIDLALEQPELFDALLDVIYERDRHAIEIMLDTPVDFILMRGYYQGTTFWSPRLFRRFFLPRIKRLVDIVHQAGRLFGYTMSVGVMPLLDAFVEMGVDANYLLDPIEGGGGQRIDLHKVKATWNGKVAVIGGINEPITLERGTREEIRQEVFDAVRILGPGGGLCLSPAEAIQPLTTWESIEILMEAWREVRDYPIRI